MVVYYGKGFAVWLASSVAGWVLAQDATSLTTSLIGGTVTLTGIGFLIWKMVTDHRVTESQRDTYELIIDTLQEEVAGARQELRQSTSVIRDLEAHNNELVRRIEALERKLAR